MRALFKSTPELSCSLPRLLKGALPRQWRLLALGGLCAVSYASSAAVIGNNDVSALTLDDPRLPIQLRDRLDAIGLLSTPCTGTHIGRGRVVTAGHCLPADAVGGDCSGITVCWGATGDLSKCAVQENLARCTRVVQRELTSDGDVAVFEVDRAPQQAILVAVLESARTARSFTLLGHHGGRSLQWVKDCKKLDTPQPSPAMFAHDCDTISGASGSAVLDSRTFEIIGIHSAGVSGSGDSYNVATWGHALATDAP